MENVTKNIPKDMIFYRDDDAVIINADCLNVMRLLDDKSIDLVLTDPPYGIRIGRKSNNFGVREDLARKANGELWDDNIPDESYFSEIFRISNEQIVFGANYFWEYFRSSQCCIIWDKRGDLPDVPFSPTEFAWSSFKRMPKKYLIRNHGFIRDSKDKKPDHPTQKPSELMAGIIGDFTEATDSILDPFMGSGTTLVAAKRLHRKAVGIEISEKYCEIAAERLANFQPSLPF